MYIQPDRTVRATNLATLPPRLDSEVTHEAVYRS